MKIYTTLFLFIFCFYCSLNSCECGCNSEVYNENFEISDEDLYFEEIDEKESIPLVYLEDEELYDFSNYYYDSNREPVAICFNTVQAAIGDPHSPEYYLEKVAKAYRSHKYKKCIEYVKDYEREINRPNRIVDVNEKVIAQTFKAYCKWHLKKYESAKDYFAEIIRLMKSGGYKPHHMFFAYFQHASCYAALGEKDKSKEKIQMLINSEVLPNLKDIQSDKVCLQPCIHPIGVYDRMIINEILAAALGQEIISLQQRTELIPSLAVVGNTNESKEYCSEVCSRVGGYAAVACAFIPHKPTQLLVLSALVEFNVECPKCCEHGLGSEHCCKNLKWALKKIGEGNNEI